MPSAPHRSTRAPRRAAAGRPQAVLLARRPALGRVKTRLAKRLGARAALRLHRAFLLDTLAFMRVLGRRGWSVRVEWSEAWRPDATTRRALRGVAGGTQAAGHLGRRIESALRRALAGGAACAVAVGADAPHVGWRVLESARRRLGRAEVVLGPAQDGGYFLIGTRRLEPRWFEGIAWGTGRVLRQSLLRMRRSRARVALLAPSYDLDTPASVARLASQMRRSATLRRSLPATRRALARLPGAGLGAWTPSRRR